MSTALFDLALSVPQRIAELNRLIDAAKRCEQDDEPLYNSICRSVSVLLASHLEGFLKELISSLIADMNSFRGGFSHMPAAMQRSFCEKIATYEGVERGDIEDRIRQLIAFFSKNSVPVDMSAFTYKDSANKNPTSAFIDSAMGKFGIPNIVSAVAGGKYDVIFDNDRFSTYILSRELRSFRSRLFHYPYRNMPSVYRFRFRGGSGMSKVQSLWHAYIEEILIRRHSVAHGDTLDNETSWAALKMDVLKLEVLMHGLMFASAAYLA